MTKLHYLAMSHMRGMTAGLARGILERLPGGIADFFSLPAAQLRQTMGSAHHLLDSEERLAVLAAAREELKFIEAHNIGVVRFNDPDGGYPPLLAEADDAPVALCRLGRTDFAGRPVVAIVGTRHATSYGAAFATELVEALAASLAVKPVIVSGLAYGIDVAAHRAALKAGLPTAAVLAHGLNTIYPAAHRSVASQIIEEGGCLLTEYWAGDTIHRGNFLARNRIVAGVADCTIVVESDLKGGAMATARIARAYEREVFAVPGRPADKYSRGCNRLIANTQAILLSDPQEVADIMKWPRKDAQALQQELFHELSPAERAVAEMLRHHGEMRVADIRSRSGMAAHELMALLVEMEFNGLVESMPGSCYRLAAHIDA